MGQLAARRYTPSLYRAVILAASTAETTMSDYMGPYAWDWDMQLERLFWWRFYC